VTGDDRQPRLVPTGDISAILHLGGQLQAAASAHQIHNVFDDGGYKELLLLTLFNLRKLDREGDDAEDEAGRRYEIKTVARVNARGARKPSLSVTTEHTLTVANLTRYRNTHLWIVAVFDQARPESIYEIAPLVLEPYFSEWERRLVVQQGLHSVQGAPPHLNNPKIPLTFIHEHGLQVWPEAEVALPKPVQQGLRLASEEPPAAPG